MWNLCHNIIKNLFRQVRAIWERILLAVYLDDTKVKIMWVVYAGVQVWGILSSILDGGVKYYILLCFQIVLAYMIVKPVYISFLAFCFPEHRSYKVGDLVRIYGEEDKVVVEKINLLTTVFKRLDNNVKVVYRNSDLPLYLRKSPLLTLNEGREHDE